MLAKFLATSLLIPSSWAGFCKKKNIVDIILFPERLPICRTQNMNQHSMGTQTCTLVYVGHSTKCQVEDKVRHCLGMSSSIAKPSSQFNTPAKSESHCRGRDQKTAACLQKTCQGVSLHFLLIAGWKEKCKSRSWNIFQKWKFWNIPRWKFFLFTLMSGPKIRTKLSQNKKEGQVKRENKHFHFHLVWNFLKLSRSRICSHSTFFCRQDNYFLGKPLSPFWIKKPRIPCLKYIQKKQTEVAASQPGQNTPVFCSWKGWSDPFELVSSAYPFWD